MEISDDILSKMPKNSTPIKNYILEDIFAKGLLTRNEMRIVSYVIRHSWGWYDKNKARRQPWTKCLTQEQIANEINMARQTVSTCVKKMILRGILKKQGQRYQFNKHYEEWGISWNKAVINYDSQVPLHMGSRVMTKNVRNSDIEQSSKQRQTGDCTIRKETNKEIFKENIHSAIARLWNLLARWRKNTGLWEVNEISPELKSHIKELLWAYDARQIKQAILNYYRFMCLQHHEKRWQGHRWTLCQFLTPEKDRILVWLDWGAVKSKYIGDRTDTMLKS